MDDFERELMAAFAEEAVEHVQGITVGLLALERGERTVDGEPLLVRTYRQAHSLKGAARTVGIAPVEHICQAMESLLAVLKAGTLEPCQEHWDELQGAIGAVQRLLQTPEHADVDAQALAARLDRLARMDAGANRQHSERSARVEPAPRDDVGDYAQGAAVASLTPEPADPPTDVRADDGPSPFASELPARQRRPPSSVTAASGQGMLKLSTGSGDTTVRVQVRKVEALFSRSEELLGAAFTQRARLAEVRSLLSRVAGWRKALEDEELTREAPPLGDQVVGMVKSVLADVRALEQHLSDDCNALDRQVRDLTDAARAVLLQPIVGALEPFHKMIRDLARDQGKVVDVQIDDSDISVDRRILEALRDPLVHVLRNSIDHGIELPGERLARGKPRRAQISLTARHLGVDTVELRVCDDGRGLNLERIQQKAIDLGLRERAELETWSDTERAQLVFASELSTSDTVSHLSGRGLGLAIVARAVEGLGGTASVESTGGLGTCIVMRLPVSLASFRGVVLQVAGQTYVAPSRAVERALHCSAAQLGTVSGTDTLAVDGVQLPAHRLERLLGLPSTVPLPGQAQWGLVVNAGGRRAVLLVDALLGEQEGLVKGLGRQLRHVRGVSGVATLAAHTLVPVLELAELLGVSQRAGSPMHHADSLEPMENSATRAPLVAVAEDSATARLLIVHLLEAAGYCVRTAGNGAEALALLHSESFDALISDVEMPVMNGFDLTASVRADPSLADLPVILVTSLESRADRERGATVGANAYVVKRNFEPQVLLAALQRWL